MSGIYPDVLGVFLFMIATRGSRDELADLNDYVDKMDDKDDFYENVFEMGSYEDKIVGLCYSPTPILFLYRKDFFIEAGLDPNKPPRNWEELKDYAQRLTKRDENGKVIRAGFDIPAVDPALIFTEPFLRQKESLQCSMELFPFTIGSFLLVEIS
jgi:ABC-type glycerol-3-phosphate transport system substrate-binding protein